MSSIFFHETNKKDKEQVARLPGDLAEHDCVPLDGLLAVGHLVLPPPPPHLREV